MGVRYSDRLITLNEPLLYSFTVPVETGPKISEHPQLGAYFKMLRLGVPAQAVKLKMAREGFEPSLLDYPQDAALPVGMEFTRAKVRNDDEDSDSSDNEEPNFD